MDIEPFSTVRGFLHNFWRKTVLIFLHWIFDQFVIKMDLGRTF